jgi:hypothetical protein
MVASISMTGIAGNFNPFLTWFQWGTFVRIRSLSEPYLNSQILVFSQVQIGLNINLTFSLKSICFKSHKRPLKSLAL